jgi:hypothetical protein
MGDVIMSKQQHEHKLDGGQKELLRSMQSDLNATVSQTNVEYKKWAEAGKLLVAQAARTQWLIGDWVLTGEIFENVAREVIAAPGQRIIEATSSKSIYQVASDITGLSRDTCEQYAYVARNVPVSIRIDSLSFAHHQLVAGMEPEEQKTWLAEWAKSGWTVGYSRQLIKEGELSNGGKKTLEMDNPEIKRLEASLVRLSGSISEKLSSYDFPPAMLHTLSPAVKKLSDQCAVFLAAASKAN